MPNEINGSVLTLDGTTLDSTCFNEETLREWMLVTAKTLEMDVIFGPVFKEVEPSSPETCFRTRVASLASA